jgi:YD repeat-containing protein
MSPLAPAFAQSSDASATATSAPAASAATASPAPDTGAGTAPAAPDAPAPAQPSAPSGDAAAAAPDASLSAAAAPSAPSAAADAAAAPAAQSGASAAKQATQGATVSQGSGAPGPGSVAAGFFNQSQFKIDKNTGAARVTYPISIPPGRNNLQPNVDLTYNSQNAQPGNIFGEGWSVGIPYIERMNKGGVDAFYATTSQKYFASSIDGELSTTTVGSNYIARTENGSFNKYTFSGGQWTMTDKKGTQYAFGSTADSQQGDPNNPANVYRWMLKQVTDTNGNTIAYSYFKDGGQVYPSSTTYTGNGASSGIFEVDFLRAANGDNGTSSAMGFGVKSNYRISEIDAKVNGTWVRKYSLGYKAGDNGATALLSSIVASGENASGTVVTLPTSTFSYQAQAAGWASNSAWNPLISLTASSSADDGVRVADVNGDGLPDIIQGYGDANGSTTFAAYVNNGAGWTVSPTWAPPVAFVSSTSDMGVRIADVNGDGLPDIIQSYSASGANYYAAYINTGGGWAASSTWNPPVLFTADGADTGARIADVNGDGLPDIIQGYADSGGVSHYAAYINNGSGWTSSSAWNPPTTFLSSSTADTGARIADVNGDGLPDVIQGYADGGGNHFAAYMNTGGGWAASSSPLWNPPVTFVSSGADTGVRIADVNGDGLPDIIQGGAAYLNNGAGWSSAPQWNPPVTFTQNGTDDGARIADVNGDGLPDIIQAYIDSDGASHYAAYVNSNRFRADLLTGITYPQGGSSSISYQSILQITDDLGNVLNGVPYPVYIVSKLTANDGTRNVATSTYTYYGGTYYTNGPFDHQFAGFTQVKETDAAGDVTKTYYHTSNGADSAHGESPDNFWKIGKPYRTEDYDAAGDLYRVVVNGWGSFGLGGNAAFVSLATTTEQDYDGLSTHADKAESYAYDDATGNQTQRTQWGQVTANDDGTFADTGADELVTNTAYATGAAGVVGLPSDVTVTDQNSSKVKETRYYYDNLALGSASAGNLTKQEDWKAGSAYVNVQNRYNSYGLVTQHLDARGDPTNYAYDTYGLYPATTTNALSQSTGYQYDYSSGQATQVTDPNGDAFLTQYDGLGRTLQVTQPDPNATSTQAVKTTYAYTDVPDGTRVRESDFLSSGAASPQELYATPLFNDASLMDYYRLEDATDAKGANGLTAAGTVAYDAAKFNNGADLGAGNSADKLYNSYAYDGSLTVSFWVKLKSEIGSGSWILAAAGTNGGSPWTNQGVIYMYNGGNRVLRFTKDRQNVTEYDADYPVALGTSNWYHVVYTFDGTSIRGYVNGTLVAGPVAASGAGTGGATSAISLGGISPGGYFQNAGYASASLDDVAYFSRALSATEVAGMDSGTQGTGVDTYTYYDGLGRVVQTRKSSENAGIYKVSDKSYNSLGLIQKESLPYFGSGNAMAAATTTGALFVSHTYDPLQRPLTTTNAVGTTANAYANWKTTTTDPRGNPKDQYADAYGDLVRVDEHNGTGKTYSTYYAYDGLRDLTGITDALGNVRSFAYDGLGRRTAAQDLHAPSDATYGSSTYAYDDAGNLTQSVDAKGQTVNYAYDGINRVLSEDYTGQAGTEYSYAYDTCTQGIGRLCVASSSDAVTSESYNALGQLTQESKTIASTTYVTGYTYDRQGNQLVVTNPDNSQVQYTYNTAGLPESVSEKEPGGSFTTIISDFDYAPTDQVSQETYANGMVVKDIYDPLQLYRLVGKVTTNVGGGQQQMMKKGGAGPLASGGGSGLITASTVTFPYTGAVASFTVPSDVYSLTITLDGAQGAASSSNRAAGGKGGQVSFTAPVASGTTFWYYLGAQGGNAVGGGDISWFSPTGTFSTSTAWAIAGGGGAGGMQVVPGACGSTGGGSGGSGGGAAGSVGSGASNSYGTAGGGGGGSQGSGGGGGAGRPWLEQPQRRRRLGGDVHRRQRRRFGIFELFRLRRRGRQRALRRRGRRRRGRRFHVERQLRRRRRRRRVVVHPRDQLLHGHEHGVRRESRQRVPRDRRAAQRLRAGDLFAEPISFRRDDHARPRELDVPDERRPGRDAQFERDGEPQAPGGSRADGEELHQHPERRGRRLRRAEPVRHDILLRDQRHGLPLAGAVDGRARQPLRMAALQLKHVYDRLHLQVLLRDDDLDLHRIGGELHRPGGSDETRAHGVWGAGRRYVLPKRRGRPRRGGRRHLAGHSRSHILPGRRRTERVQRRRHGRLLQWRRVYLVLRLAHVFFVNGDSGGGRRRRRGRLLRREWQRRRQRRRRRRDRRGERADDDVGRIVLSRRRRRYANISWRWRIRGELQRIGWQRKPGRVRLFRFDLRRMADVRRGKRRRRVLRRRRRSGGRRRRIEQQRRRRRRRRLVVCLPSPRGHQHFRRRELGQRLHHDRRPDRPGPHAQFAEPVPRGRDDDAQRGSPDDRRQGGLRREPQFGGDEQRPAPGGGGARWGELLQRRERHQQRAHGAGQCRDHVVQRDEPCGRAAGAHHDVPLQRRQPVRLLPDGRRVGQQGREPAHERRHDAVQPRHVRERRRLRRGQRHEIPLQLLQLPRTGHHLLLDEA